MGVKTKTDFDFWIEKLSFFFISFTKFILKYRVFLFLILGLIIVGFIVIAVKDNRDESLINSFNAELVGFLKKSPGTEQSDNLENLKKSPGIILDVVAAIEIENALTQNDLSLAYLAAMNHIEEASFLKIPRLLSAIELKRQEGKNEEAIQYLDSQSTNETFNDSHLLLLKADLLAEKGNWTEALKIYEKLSMADNENDLVRSMAVERIILGLSKP
ncbi:MAG: hypothetical protein A3G32_08090 [Deltaproteobacteria bacterium RIFCSPLOWO2_12_FULL_40_28]|nr:MAG: hypothetical protein A3C45_00790 [Deltaproteobacteria bacterium RIFCSPHIGHO2_02_FULL_40_28]OGQ20870.1 MAG: hypothetical protein A3E27_03455 [Deltaproteobacteria bacterium RIFCSPHIGHO2_12_FULL_40_32]OGQ39271.1 MAG: hypothetical protein A3I69_04815 [Deltaproteobacteria bacterium RIFCSPLOWO2_02_FULL_40_36]OGQ54552.1 MAG: hypothetical protein A3G32_08090 [Deltaproteobacteria bacterium RIFCSPLOWO2_12_FULL_40_28]